MLGPVTDAADSIPVVEEGIRLVAHDPGWPRAFERERLLLEPLLAPFLAGGIHHIGSTAVAGMTAKPVIDIMAGVRDLDQARAVIPGLAALNYCYFPYRDWMLWFCKPRPDLRTHHLHLVPHSHPEFERRLAFRDLLRRDPASFREYLDLKLRLAELFPCDREAYTDGKAELVARLSGLAVNAAPP